MDFEPIPDFLKIPQEVRAEAWKGRKLTRPNGDIKQDYTMPRSIDAVGKAILKQQQKDKAERAKARLAALKGRK